MPDGNRARSYYLHVVIFHVDISKLFIDTCYLKSMTVPVLP